MTLLVYILILLVLGLFAAILETYWSSILAAIKQLWRIVLPKKKGVVRLCLALSVALSIISFTEIPKQSGIGQIVCGWRYCYLFGEPNFATIAIVFCVPFVVAKAIEFVFEGVKEQK